jgi:hypothetical protein
MDRIWIAMGMGWGVSRGGSDADVNVKKTEARAMGRDYVIRSEEISFFCIKRKREMNQTAIFDGDDELEEILVWP